MEELHRIRSSARARKRIILRYYLKKEQNMSNEKSKMHSNLQDLISQLAKLCKEPVLDIVIFGSAVKGKENPNDLDVAIIFSKEDYDFFDKLSAKIKSASSFKIQTELLSVSKLFEEPLFLTLLHEGISCKHKKSLASVLKSQSIALLTYSLTNLDKVQKTQFGYALKGRTKESSFLKELGGEVVGRNGFIVPISKLEPVKELLNSWKIKFTTRRLISVPNYIR